MPFRLLWEVLPELAERETRTVILRGPQNGLPADAYTFREMFCDEKGCDCRRAFFWVDADARPGPEAVIAWGWEDEAFYRKWLHHPGDRKTARQLQGPILNPGSPKTELAPRLLKLFRAALLSDPDYVSRVKRHYRQFRTAIETGDPSTVDEAERAWILRELEFNRGYYPRDAVEEAVRRRDETIPLLLDGLAKTVARAKEEEIDDDYFLHLHAMFLLAQFREKRAYPLVADLCRLPPKKADDLLGGAITEGLCSVLASVCGGDTALIKSLIEDAAVNEWVRGAAIRSLSILAYEGIVPRAEVLAYFAELFHGKLEREFSQPWNALVTEALDLYAKSLEPEIREAFEDGLVERFSVRVEEVDQTFSRSEKEVLAESNERQRGLIESAVDEMGWWCCFEPRPEKKTDAVPGAELFEVPWSRTVKYGLPVRTGPDIGRNAPCPCGSGKKYKKCCGAADAGAGKYG